MNVPFSQDERVDLCLNIIKLKYNVKKYYQNNIGIQFKTMGYATNNQGRH